MHLIKKTIVYILIFVFLINTYSYSTSSNATLSNTISSNSIINDESKNEAINKGFFSDNLKVGDEVEFGRFYDLNDDEEIVKMPIKWMVLDRLNEFALLITKDIIKTMPYNYSWSPTNWKESNIRIWLNYDFYDIAFNNLEKEKVRKIITENVGNHAQNVFIDFQTYDNVFLLSIEEAKKYFKLSKDYMAVGTKYAIKEGLWISSYATSVGYSVWWLRSPGKSMSSAAVVHAAGGIGYGGDGVATRGNGLRPCIWVECN